MRYACPANLIFLCAKCHSALHFDNFNVASIYSLKRGKQWEAEIMDIKRQPSMTIGVNRFEEITYYYENNIPEKWELEPTK